MHPGVCYTLDIPSISADISTMDRPARTIPGRTRAAAVRLPLHRTSLPFRIHSVESDVKSGRQSSTSEGHELDLLTPSAL